MVLFNKEERNKVKKLTGVILILLCVACIVLGLLILKTGFEKKDNYYNPE